jgi:DNA invertase Pin-like site-specific DNA recombinase
MRVAIYGRVSTGHQVDHQTIEQQIERLTAHVVAHQAKVGRWTRPTCSATTATAAPRWLARVSTGCVTP